MRAAALINPQSGGGKTITVWRQLGDKLNRSLAGVTVFFSERRGHITELTRHVVASGFDRLIVVGGDGTLHECVNGLFDNSRPLFPESLRIGILNGGRGCDYTKTLAVGDTPEEMLATCLGENVLRVDVGRVELESGLTKLYMNSSCFGLGGDIAASVQSGSAFLPPTASYFSATLRALWNARARRMELKLEGRQIYSGPAQNVFVCNGKFSGGGMLWAPRAELTDGLLNALLLPDLSRMDLLKLTPKVYGGDLEKIAGISAFTASEIEIESPDGTIVELDGETYESKKAKYSVLKRVLPVLFRN